MRNRIVGAIGVLWGGGILASHFLREQPQDKELTRRVKPSALYLASCCLRPGCTTSLKAKGSKQVSRNKNGILPGT